MKDFHVTKILIPTDFSETGLLAIEHGTFMAKLFQAELHLIHVLEVNEYSFDIPEPILRFSNLEAVQGIAARKMDEVADGITKDSGLKPITLCTTGKIAGEVVGYADDNNIDLIIMGTHGASGFEEYFIGSNAHKVVNQANCPVISVQTHAKKLGFSNIVLPIDDALHSRQKVSYAIELAKKYASKIHILGLLDSEDDNPEGKFNIKLDAVEDVVKKAGLPFSRKVILGDHMAAEALKYSEQIGADLIVIMTDHESKLTGMYMGPFAKQIVNHSKIPVMSIRPAEGHMSSYNPAGGPGLNS
ncbi:MAG: universal stress protein, partial [Bacteroidia bacterium]